MPKSETEELVKLYDNNVILDSAYYVGTLSKSNDLTIKLFKNGNRHKSFLNSEKDKKTFNYLCLVSFNKIDNPIDYKIIYYNNIDDIQSYKRFFYIDKNLNIHTKDFMTDELLSKNLKNGYYRILNDGTLKNTKDE